MTSTEPNGFEGEDRRKNLAEKLRVADLSSSIKKLQQKQKTTKPSTRLYLIAEASALASAGIDSVKRWVEERGATILIPKKTLETLDGRKNGTLPTNLNARAAISFIERTSRGEPDKRKGKVLLQHQSEAAHWASECIQHLQSKPSVYEVNLIKNATMKESDEPKPEDSGEAVISGFVKTIVQCAIWRLDREPTRDWTMVTEDPLITLWCRAYGVPVKTVSEVEQLYRQRVSEVRAYKQRLAEAEARGSSNSGAASSASNPTSGTAAAVPDSAAAAAASFKRTPVVDSAPAPTFASPVKNLNGGSIWSDSAGGWDNNGYPNFAFQSGFQGSLQGGFGFPPMPPTHLMNVWDGKQGGPGGPVHPGGQPGPQFGFQGYEYNENYNQPDFNYAGQNQQFHNQTHNNYNQNLQAHNNFSHVPFAENNDFSHFDSFDFLDEEVEASPEPAPKLHMVQSQQQQDKQQDDEMRRVEQQLKEALNLSAASDVSAVADTRAAAAAATSPALVAPAAPAAPAASAAPELTPVRLTKSAKGQSQGSQGSQTSDKGKSQPQQASQQSQSSESAPVTPVRAPKGPKGESRSTGYKKRGGGGGGGPSGGKGMRKNAPRPNDPDFVKRGSGVLWSPRPNDPDFAKRGGGVLWTP